MMTKKDYIAIAKCIADGRERISEGTHNGYDAIEYIASELGYVMRMDNPNFDRQKFLKACGVEK